MSSKETYIKRYQAARAELLEIVKRVDGNPQIYAPWRMKEVLDHITGWDDAMIASIRSFLAGDVPATPASRGIDSYNADTVSSRETIPYEVTLREWEASRNELLVLLAKMTDEQLHTPFGFPWGGNGTIEDLVEIFTEHEETHAREIREILEQNEK
jgi:hypothetical protein